MMGTESVVSATAHVAESLLRSIRWQDDVPGVLKLLAEAFDVARISLYQKRNDTNTQVVLEQGFSWPTFPEKSAKDVLLEASWAKRLSEGEIVSCDAKPLPFVGEDSRSILLAPVFVSDGWWGFFALEDARKRTWKRFETDAILAFARLLGVTIGRQSSERHLRDSEERYRILVEKAPVAIAVQREGKLLFLNKAAADILGAKDPQELIGRKSMDFVHPESCDVIRKRLESLKQKASIPPGEFRFVRFDGTPIVVQLFSRRTLFNLSLIHI